MSVSLPTTQILKTVSAKVNKKLFLAACHPCDIPNAVRVDIKQLDWDAWLKMYFKKWVTFYAHDTTGGKVKQGDIVLVEELPQQMTRDITHEIKKIVYPYGDMTDPVTGKKCVSTVYREDMKRISQLYGENPKLTFDYDTAPPRGWQEGRKDFTHKKGYRKFHEFTDRDQTEAEWGRPPNSRGNVY